MQIKPTRIGFLSKYRTLILISALILFLPPLAVIFQVVTGDNNFCGKWCPRMFFIWRQGITSQQYFMGMMRSYMGVALVLGILGTTFFLGRYWCGHFCPIGGATELGSKLVPKFLKLDFSSVPAAPVRYGYLAVYIIAPLVGAGSLCCNYCNFSTIPRIAGAAFSQADLVYFFRAYGIINLMMVGVLGFFAKGGRAYCNFFCPIGAMDAAVGKIGASFGKRVRIKEDRCNNCGLCKDVCPTWAIKKESATQIDQLSCISCRECEKVCPRSAIAYGKTTMNPAEQNFDIGDSRLSEGRTSL
jgi:ferredoxin-type protein NapH